MRPSGRRQPFGAQRVAAEHAAVGLDFAVDFAGTSGRLLAVGTTLFGASPPPGDSTLRVTDSGIGVPSGQWPYAHRRGRFVEPK